MDRRHFLGALGAAGIAGASGGLARAAFGAAQPVADLRIQAASYDFGAGATQGMVSLSPDAAPPVIRMLQGRPFVADVTNTLDDYVAMHWHGMRIPNGMDGVPYVTQFPIGQNETFRYEYTPPDAGTYWYHPHCNTMNQMARGLTGMLIVEEPDPIGFDSEQAVNLRDFRLGSDGQFIDLFTGRGAARGGTLGAVMTANWAADPVYDHAAGGLVRLRIVATDTTRIYKLHVEGAEGQVIAMDGQPLRVPLDWPTGEAPLVLAPGQRADLAIRMPAIEGAEVSLINTQAGGPRSLMRLRAVGSSLNRDLAELAALPAPDLALPDLENAEVHEFLFGWSPSDVPVDNGFCGTLGYTFWSINRAPWQGENAGSGPLATLAHGKSHILRLKNESPNDHPIHLHGLAFIPFRSNKRAVAPNWTDTALLLEGETMEVALVADNPGNWAFHCHVIEHAKTGLAGYVRVA